MKQKKTLLVLIAVFLILVGGITWLLLSEEKPKSKPESIPDEGTERNIVYTANQDDITEVTYVHPDETFSIVKKGDEWVFGDEPDLPVSQPRADGVSYDMQEFIAAEIVEENATDVAKYGLEPAHITTALSFKDGSKACFYVGSKVQGENGYYVKIGDENTVYMVTAAQCESLLYTKEDMLAMTLQEFYITDIESITLSRRDGEQFTVTQKFAGMQEEWVLSSPFAWSVDETALKNKLLRFVTAIDALSYVTDQPESALGLSTASVTVTVKTTEGKSHSCYIGNVASGKNGAYIKVDGIGYPAIVDLQIIQLTKLTKFDIIDKTVETADYDRIQSVVLSGDVDMTLRYGDNPELNGKKITKETAIKLYSDICELTVDAVGTSVSGESVLTVKHIYKNGDTKNFKVYMPDAYQYVITADGKTFFKINRDTYIGWKKLIESYL